MRIDRLSHRFVETIPEQLEARVLYVSMEFRTTMHLCCCGCGVSVVLPLRPTAWRMTFDGDSVTMAPSVGNWSFPCRSHYLIREGRVVWARDWSTDRIEANRRATLVERRTVAETTDPTGGEHASEAGWLSRERNRPLAPTNRAEEAVLRPPSSTLAQ